MRCSLVVNASLEASYRTFIFASVLNMVYVGVFDVTLLIMQMPRVILQFVAFMGGARRA